MSAMDVLIPPLQSWANFNLVGQMQSLSVMTQQIRDQKEQSLAARKHLGDTTKQFKRSVKNLEQASSSLKSGNGSIEQATTIMDSLAKECKNTVKSYQEEINNLTRRCKSSEQAFQNLVTGLDDLSDPASVLQTALELLHEKEQENQQLQHDLQLVTKQKIESQQQHQQQQQQAQAAQAAASAAAQQAANAQKSLPKGEKEELIRLRKEVAEYEVEFRSLKNQDVTIRKLQSKINELEKGSKEKFSKELEKAQSELAETEGRRAAEALEREAAMERRLKSLELQLKAERAGREATQTLVLEEQDGAGEREAAWEAQRLILVNDAERLRETLYEAERERDELRLKVAATENPESSSMAKSPTSGGGQITAVQDMLLERKAFEAEVNELSQTANSLRDELRLKDEVVQQERRMAQKTIDQTERELARVQKQLQEVQLKLSEAPSVTYVESMQRELRILKRLEYNANETPEMTGESAQEEQDFEAVLVNKLKKVESELVKERNAKVELSRDNEHLKVRIKEAEEAKTRADKMVVGLEADLERALLVVTPNTTKKVAKIPTASVNDDEDENLETILDNTGTEGIPAPPLTKSAFEKAQDDHSVATIVMAQRDRLRARCDALEAERDSFKRELQVQVQAAESLKIDNTKLYEKMRYLQNYNPQNRHGNRSVGKMDLDLEALEQRYEASVDPFRQFSRTEKQRRIQEMSPMERIVYVVAKTVLASKEMRTFLFFYVVAMHLLVFFSTFQGSSGHCDDSNHHEALAHLPPNQAMIANGGGASP